MCAVCYNPQHTSVHVYSRCVQFAITHSTRLYMCLPCSALRQNAPQTLSTLPFKR